MRKLFISVIALAMSLMTMATETAYVELILSGASGLEDYLYLTEDDSYSNAYEDGADAAKIMYQANTRSVLIYGMIGSLECGEVVAKNLEGMPIGITTNNIDQNYTITFDVAEGRTLKLYDRLLDVTTDIVEGDSYDFSVDASLVGRHAINDRFFIDMDADDFAYSLTTNAYGWASYSNNVDLKLFYPAGLKIYTGEFDGVETLDLTAVDYVEAGEGVMVKGAPNTTYYFAAGSGSSVYGTNDFKPASDWTSALQNVFVLKGEALYEYIGVDPIPANKAFFQLPGSAPAPKRISFRFDATQGIEDVQGDNVQCTKLIEDGQVLIKRGEVIYTLQGQMVR